MAQDQVPQPQPQPEPPAPDEPSVTDNVRDVMLGIGEIGMALGGDGSPSYEPGGDTGRPRTWWGTILMWVWAVVALLLGLLGIAVFFLDLFL
jgi:hypothetical protein